MTGDRWGPPPSPGRGDWPGDVRARLFDRRVVFVAGRLEAGVAAQAAMEIMTLDGTGDGAISLQLECRDGDLEAALSLMDVVELAGVPVHTTALGLVAGPPVGVVAVSARRLATPNARFGLFEARTAYAGQARDLERWAEHTLERNRLFCARLAAAVGQAPERVEADVERGTYLSAEEARDYGLIDEIVGPLGRITALPGPPMGFGPR